MRYAKIEKNSIANGPGIRVVLWCQGCSIGCKNCHNPETWDKHGGYKFDEAAKHELFDELDKPWVQGITISGGHPFEDYNIKDVIKLLVDIFNRYKWDKDVWIYTGKTLSMSDINNDPDLMSCFKLSNVIVDGPYIEEQRNLSLPYYGSNNQRAIDTMRTLLNNQIILFKSN